MRSFLLIVSLFFLASCSNRLPRSAIVNTDTIVLNNGSKITILTEHAIYGDVVYDTNNHLNVVTRGDTAQVVGLKVAQFAIGLFGGVGGSVNGFTKEDLKGTYITSVPNQTMDILKPQFYVILKKLKANKQKENTITIRPYKFKLIYDGLTDNKYNFIYNTTIRSDHYSFECSSDDLVEDDKSKPYTDWEENNYQLVQDVTSKAITACMNRLKSSKNISDLERALN